MSAQVHNDTGLWRRRRVRLIVAALGVAVASLLVWGFFRGREEGDTDEEDRPVAQPSRVQVVNGETEITFDSATRARGGVVVAPAVAGSGGGATGYGTVVPLDTLSTLHNAYVTAQSGVSQASARLDASRREYERLSALERENQNAAPKAVEAARAQMLTDQAALEAASAAARTAAAVARQTWGSVVGDWIIKDSPQFQQLLDGREVLVQVTVPLDVPLAAPSRTVRVSAGPGAAVTARYASTAARTDLRVQGRSFYYIAPASPTLLSGMNVTATLAGAGTTQGGIVPDSAVVWLNGTAWIYVQIGPSAFARRQISTAVRTPTGSGYVVPTIAAGTPIVVSGAQVLVSEEARSSLQTEGG